MTIGLLASFASSIFAFGVVIHRDGKPLFAKLSNDWGPSLTVRRAEGPVDEPFEALMDHMEGMDNSNDH